LLSTLNNILKRIITGSIKIISFTVLLSIPGGLIYLGALALNMLTDSGIYLRIMIAIIGIGGLLYLLGKDEV